MSWYSNIEKKIADSLVGALGKARAIEQTVVAEVKTLEQKFISEEKSLFESAREAALQANNDVNRIKVELQVAMARAAQLHQSAVDTAKAAQAAAEADVTRFKAMVVAHSSDFAAQSGPITIAPVPVVVDVVDTTAYASDRIEPQA